VEITIRLHLAPTVDSLAAQRVDEDDMFAALKDELSKLTIAMPEHNDHVGELDGSPGGSAWTIVQFHHVD